MLNGDDLPSSRGLVFTAVTVVTTVPQGITVRSFSTLVLGTGEEACQVFNSLGSINKNSAVMDPRPGLSPGLPSLALLLSAKLWWPEGCFLNKSRGIVALADEELSNFPSSTICSSRVFDLALSSKTNSSFQKGFAAFLATELENFP